MTSPAIRPAPTSLIKNVSVKWQAGQGMRPRPGQQPVQSGLYVSAKLPPGKSLKIKEVEVLPPPTSGGTPMLRIRLSVAVAGVADPSPGTELVNHDFGMSNQRYLVTLLNEHGMPMPGKPRSVQIDARPRMAARPV